MIFFVRVIYRSFFITRVFCASFRSFWHQQQLNNGTLNFRMCLLIIVTKYPMLSSSRNFQGEHDSVILHFVHMFLSASFQIWSTFILKLSLFMEVRIQIVITNSFNDVASRASLVIGIALSQSVFSPMCVLTTDIFLICSNNREEYACM